METISFTLENHGNEADNEKVLQAEAFQLREYVYRFRLQPRSEYWRFGIRINDSRNRKDLFKTIFIGAGRDSRGKWDNPSLIQLAQEGFASQDSVLNNFPNYEPLEPIDWYIQYVPAQQGIFVSYSIYNALIYTSFLNLEKEDNFFQIVAWSRSIDYQIDCNLDVFHREENDQNNNPFQLGNLEFRLGNMFDEVVTKRVNFTLLPASSNGTATASFVNAAEILGLPAPPPPRKAGQLLVMEIPDMRSKRSSFVGYAYSVNSHTSDEKVLTTLCNNIKSYASSNNNIKCINIPLFSTGAGGLRPKDVAFTYLDIFNNKDFNLPVIVSIPSNEIYKDIKQLFSGAYFSLPPEILPKKPTIIESLEESLNIELNTSDYKIDADGIVFFLNLSHQQLFSSRELSKFTHLREINLNNAGISDVRFLLSMERLESLSASNTRIDLDSIANLKNLTTLDLSGNQIDDLRFLAKFRNLRRLRLRDNEIIDISLLNELRQLEYVDLSQNRIRNIEHFKNLSNLVNLNLSSNNIHEIEPIKQLKRLEILDISDNNVLDAKVISGLRKLRYLKADKNPLTKAYELILDDKEDHLLPIRNYLARQEEKNKVPLTLPVKILLLGNHASGKSSLLYYIQHNKLSEKMDSTHIIRIEKYPKDIGDIPEAIFFDFGGQDYYHGIYRAFLSGGALYVLLWQEDTNVNQQRIDSNLVVTQDFSLDYWLCQKRYLEKEKFQEEEESPIVLIQTHADIGRRNYVKDVSGHRIENDFFVDLKKHKGNQTSMIKANQLGLDYLKAVILSLGERNRIKRKEPQWYVDFIAYILYQNQSSDHQCKNLEKDILPYYQREDDYISSALSVDLDQLHKQGLILYYKNEMPDKVWLNPVALVKYIHENILCHKLLKAKEPGIISYDDLAGFDQDIIAMLVYQKVLFKHEQNREFIVPNFLPLAAESEVEFDLLTFGLGKPQFTLKFKSFLPFGLINQIICFFGDLPDLKKFWRDQLLFTLSNNVKILINIDFQRLEIKVYTLFNKSLTSKEQLEITNYLFYGILGLYWDLDLLNFEDYKTFCKQDFNIDDFDFNQPMYLKYQHAENFYQNEACRPLDLYISVDEQNFINYKNLCSESGNVMIQSYKLDSDNQIIISNTLLPIYPFQPFTRNELKKPKKAVISYSKKDIKLVNKFRQYLVPLSDDGLIEDPWFCSELIAGTPWDEAIQSKFDAAEIIFFMISENLMATKYVKEYEIKKAIDRWNKDGSIMIVPILLTPYHWARNGDYDLSKFTGLPYTTYPITKFPNQNEAWNYVSEAIRIMIDQKIYPGSDSYKANNAMEEFYNVVMNLRLDK